MPYARVRGVELFYEEYGSGPPVVVAHGALGSVRFAAAFGVNAALAARGLRVIAYDARGHGRSAYTTTAADYDKVALAADLLAFMDALGVARAAIYGTSMGATTALLVALAHPERVERLVLRSPAPFGADMIAPRRMLLSLAWSYQLLGASLTSRLLTVMPGTRDAHRTRGLLRDQRREAIVPALRGFLAEPLAPECLESIVAPTLVLTQPDDRLHPLSAGEILRDRMPHAELRVAPSATYWHDRADELVDVIAAFLRHGPPSPSGQRAPESARAAASGSQRRPPSLPPT